MRLNKEIVKKGYDIVIIARGNIKDKKYADVESAYIHLCKLHHCLMRKEMIIVDKEISYILIKFIKIIYLL